MIIHEKTTENEYMRAELLFPSLAIGKKHNCKIGEYTVTKLDLSTKFVLKERKNNASIEIRLLGFGLSFYFSWRKN
jgi:hypothetical protein